MQWIFFKKDHLFLYHVIARGELSRANWEAHAIDLLLCSLFWFDVS